MPRLLPDVAPIPAPVPAPAPIALGAQRPQHRRSQKSCGDWSARVSRGTRRAGTYRGDARDDELEHGYDCREDGGKDANDRG